MGSATVLDESVIASEGPLLQGIGMMRRISRGTGLHSWHQYTDEQRRFQWLTRLRQVQRGSQSSIYEAAGNDLCDEKAQNN